MVPDIIVSFIRNQGNSQASWKPALVMEDAQGRLDFFLLSEAALAYYRQPVCYPDGSLPDHEDEVWVRVRPGKVPFVTDIRRAASGAPKAPPR